MNPEEVCCHVLILIFNTLVLLIVWGEISWNSPPPKYLNTLRVFMFLCHQCSWFWIYREEGQCMGWWRCQTCGAITTGSNTHHWPPHLWPWVNHLTLIALAVGLNHYPLYLSIRG
jgi:hypothetical protein